jgi:hypothetical protein
VIGSASHDSGCKPEREREREKMPASQAHKYVQENMCADSEFR